MRKLPFWQTPRSSGSSSTRTDFKSCSGTTSDRDNDSQSISSYNTIVPEFMTTFPASPGVGPDHAAVDVSTLTGKDQAAAATTTSLVHHDAVSVAVEVSETPAKSKQLEIGSPCPNQAKAPSRENEGPVSFQDRTLTKRIVDSLQPQKMEPKETLLSLALIPKFRRCFIFGFPVGLIFLLLIFVISTIFLWREFSFGHCDTSVEDIARVLRHHDDMIKEIRSRVVTMESLIFNRPQNDTLFPPTSNTTFFTGS